MPSNFFVRNYFAGFTNDPIVNLGNVGKEQSVVNGVGDMAHVKSEEITEDKSTSDPAEIGDTEQLR